MAQIGDK